MAEYIDRTEIFKGCSFIIPEKADAALTVQKLLEHINSMPAADVVEVIRCKNCKNSSHHEFFWTCKRGQIEILVSPDGFCNEGKPRKEQ